MGGGGQTARIGIDRISDAGGVGPTLKVDSMERKGHVDAELSGVRHAQSGWAPAQAIITRPHQVRQMDL